MTAFSRFLAIISVIFMTTEAFTGDHDDKKQNQPIPVDSKEYARFVSAFDYKKHTVSLSEFLKIRKKPEVIVADLRPLESYKLGHVTGAIHLGSDITAELLSTVAPDRKTHIVVYCTNSIMPTRMVSLTDVALPQIALLGYANVWMLDPIWRNPKNDPKSLPWDGEGGP